MVPFCGQSFSTHGPRKRSVTPVKEKKICRTCCTSRSKQDNLVLAYTCSACKAAKEARAEAKESSKALLKMAHPASLHIVSNLQIVQMGTQDLEAARGRILRWRRAAVHLPVAARQACTA